MPADAQRQEVGQIVGVGTLSSQRRWSGERRTQACPPDLACPPGRMEPEAGRQPGWQAGRPRLPGTRSGSRLRSSAPSRLP